MDPNTPRREHARRLMAAGQFGEALALLAQGIKDSPRDIDSIFLSGICSARSGNHAAAEKHFSRAAKLNKGLFQAYTEMGVSQSCQGRLNDALKSFQKALAINPDCAPAHAHLARAYLQRRETGKALQHAKKCVKIDASNPMYGIIQALCYRESNQPEKAIEILRALIATHPQFHGAYQNLYETYRLAHDIPNAEQTLLVAKSTFSTHAKMYLDLGKFYEQCNRAQDALKAYAQGLENCGDNPDLLVSLGRVSRLLGHFDEGVAHIDRVLEIDGYHQPALTERCSFYTLRGEYQEAHTLLHAFVVSPNRQPLTPGLAIAYAQACRLTGRYEESLATLRGTLETPGLPEDIQSVIHFAIGDSYDKLQKHDAAFTAYRQANAGGGHASDIGYYLGVLSDIGSGIRSTSRAADLPLDTRTRKPVFIIGMPRSGTSLAEQIVASHPDAHGAGEITELWRIAQDACGSRTFEHYTQKLSELDGESITAYATRYLAFIENLAPGALRITDKLPHNFMHIALIRRLFPEASIIHCHRHPFDTCLSIYFKRFNDNHRYARSLSDIAQFYVKYRELMALWEATPANIFSLRYEELVTNPEPVTRGLIGHIGLDWHDNCLRHHESQRIVTTLSYTQANREIYTGSIHRWKHYQRHLQPLVDVLGDPEQFC